ncbi:MAG: hypothetical protein RIG77_11505 [Cyclobacteriaceae bacterium]
MSTHAHIPFEANNYYHIYNRGNNGGNIFFKEENYAYFLKQYDAYLSGFLETYAFSLLPNHFHFLIRVKEKNDFEVGKNFPSLGDFGKFKRRPNCE